MKPLDNNDNNINGLNQKINDTALSDEALVFQAQNDSENSFNILVNRYYPLICKKAYGFLSADNDDLIQEGLLGLWSAVQSYRQDKNTSFKTYASKCIDNRMISKNKKSKSKKTVPAERLIYLDSDDSKQIENNENPEQSFIEQENYMNAVKRIREVLSDRELKILSYYLAGYTYAQISKALSCDTKSIDNAIQRVRRKLRKNNITR